MQSHVVHRNGLIFHHRNEAEFELLYREIFEAEEYRVAIDRDDPTILDCGSHIGLSIAWFKRRYRLARIVAFEPEPGNLRLLRMNLALNGFDDVEVIDKAVSSRNATARFFGDFRSPTPMASAHSLTEAWGTQQSDQTIEVGTVALADYITRPIDYLKLDIEGMETEVLASIRDRLHLVRAAGIEFHGTGAQAESDEASLLSLLRESGFEVGVRLKARGEVFPPELQGWVQRVQPYLSVIDAFRR